MENINKTLLSLQEEWIQLVADPFISKGFEEQFSKPFHLGLSDRLNKNKKLVMLIGQEASDFWTYENNEIVSSNVQQWCIDYYNKQLFHTVNSERYNRSPFWAFFRSLYKQGIDVCWNNLDKLHRYESKTSKDGAIKLHTIPLSLEHQLELSRQYGSDRKSLLQREIKAVSPHAIVFLTGPYYSASMCSAFGLSSHALDLHTPTKKCFVTQIEQIIDLNIPVFWTYHPNYLCRNSGYTARVVSSIIDSLA